MNEQANQQNRKALWVALSDLYLDTELENSELQDIAEIIRISSFTLSEVIAIDKYEVYPVLRSNLSSMVGIWNSFDETWLIEKITARKRSKFNDWMIGLSYAIHRCIHRKYWKEIESSLIGK